MSMYDTGSKQGGVAVTPSDSTVVNCTAIWIGGAGNLVVTMKDGQVLTFAVAANTLLPISVTRVRAATTATLIIALY